MEKFVDPEKLIMSSSVGLAFPCRDVWNNETHTDFLVREESKLIKKLHNPKVEFRGGLSIYGNVCVVVVMFRMGTSIFETFWNYHAEGTTPLFDDMCNQDSMAIHCYGNTGKEKSVVINNPLKEFFKEVVEKIKPMPLWTMQEFDRAKEQYYRDNPNPMDAWEKLAGFLSQN